MSTTDSAIRDAALLDRRITVQQKGEVQDETGQPIVGWTDLFTTWATVEPLQGTERVQAQQLTAAFDTRFTLRWRPDVPLAAAPGTFRVVFDGRNYDVQSTAELGRREGLLLEGRWTDAPAGGLGLRLGA